MTKFSGKVLTVLGPVEPSSLGITLMHEHLLMDVSPFFKEPTEASEKKHVNEPVTIELLGSIRYNWFENLDNLRLTDEQTAVEEILEFKHSGGGTVVDTTSIGLARDPLGLKRIAIQTGLNIISGSGYYVAQVHPRESSNRTIEDIAEEIIHDINDGIGDTGVHAGIIGEIGNSHPWIETEKKVVRASARAQQKTGAPITFHPGRDSKSPMMIIQLLKEEGANLERVVMGHMDNVIDTIQGFEEVADEGVYTELDLFGWESLLSHGRLRPS